MWYLCSNQDGYNRLDKDITRIIDLQNAADSNGVIICQVDGQERVQDKSIVGARNVLNIHIEISRCFLPTYLCDRADDQIWSCWLGKKG